MFSKSSFGAPKNPFGYSSRNINSPFTSLNEPSTSSNSFERNNNQAMFNSNNVFNNPNNSMDYHQSNMDASMSIEMLENTKEQMGTAIKFSAFKSSESVFKGGMNQTVNIAFQNISCMKEYEDKSFEELRIEDYQVNRKGHQQELFGNLSNKSSLFNNTAPTFNSVNFIQKDASSIFGQNATDVKQTHSLFHSFQTNNLFGSNTANNLPFPTQPSTGSLPTTTNFLNSSLFDKMTTFNSTFTPSINPLGIFGQTTPNNSLAFSGPNITNNNNQSIFTNKAVAPTFGNQIKSKSVRGGGYPTGAGNTTQLNSLGTTTSFNILTTPKPGTSYQSQKIEQQPMTSLLSASYDTSNLFDKIATSDKNFKELTKPTNPRELNTVLKPLKVKPSTPADKKKPTQGYERKEPIFTGLEHYDEELVLNTKISNNRKRLVIRNNTSNNSYSLNVRDSLSTDLLNTTHIVEETLYDELQALQKKVSNNYRNNFKSISNSLQNITISGMKKDEINTETNSSSTSSYETSEDGPILHSPAGIILTRPEYYTVPSMDEIINYINKDGSCLVQGFTIGRYGYGSVCFPDTFDVSNLNIDELVHFSNKDISIYPDDSKKPPLGQGLNRRAQVTLENIFPRNKETKTVITDVNTLIELDYSTSLRKFCEDQETHFIDYRPETGTWVFKVDHF